MKFDKVDCAKVGISTVVHTGHASRLMIARGISVKEE